jgi:division protein CdvB (Snf7/Vps24/ESCRT-III family)
MVTVGMVMEVMAMGNMVAAIITTDTALDMVMVTAVEVMDVDMGVVVMATEATGVPVIIDL